MSFNLERSRRIEGAGAPLLLVILDGFGIGAGDEYDATALARTPTLDRLYRTCPNRSLVAHGTAVGLPTDGDMGNSEVCHNALGAGRIFDQGAKLVNRAIADGSIFEGEVWKKIVSRCIGGDGALHFVGLLSDGNVHSHEDHLHAMIRRADRDGVKDVHVHVLLDGRDVPATSALTYVDRLEALLAEFRDRPDRRYRIASGGGRMITTMDRYEADWRIVERGWKAHVHGEARGFATATEAIETYRTEAPDLGDQFLPPFVLTEQGRPVGRIEDGDAVVLFNFRGDRALEISRAFEQGEGFSPFDRGRVPDVLYAGMTLYDGDFLIPKNYLVAPPSIERTMGEYLSRNGVRQLALSETQKYGHVTYFWNGNRGGRFDEELETYVEIRSDLVPFEQRPWMKAAEITDRTIAALDEKKQEFCRINYPNGDMVGHTGSIDATVIAVEALDLCIARLLPAVDRTGATLVIVADHGNADDMVIRDKAGRPKLDEKGVPKTKTSHSLNPVPFILYGSTVAGLSLREDLGEVSLGHVAATLFELMGFEPPGDYLPSLLA